MDGAATLTMVASIIGIVEKPSRARSLAVPPRDDGRAVTDSWATVRFTVTTLRTEPEPHQEADHPGTTATTHSATSAMTIAEIRGMLSG